MLDGLGKKILLKFFKGIIHLEKNEEIGFNKWSGEITKNHAKIKPDVLDYFEVS